MEEAIIIKVHLFEQYVVTDVKDTHIRFANNTCIYPYIVDISVPTQEDIVLGKRWYHVMNDEWHTNPIKDPSDVREILMTSSQALAHSGDILPNVITQLVSFNRDEDEVYAFQFIKDGDKLKFDKPVNSSEIECTPNEKESIDKFYDLFYMAQEMSGYMDNNPSGYENYLRIRLGNSKRFKELDEYVFDRFDLITRKEFQVWKELSGERQFGDFLHSILSEGILIDMFGEPLRHSLFGENFDDDRDYLCISYFVKVNGVKLHIKNDHRGTNLELELIDIDKAVETFKALFDLFIDKQ